MYSGIYWKIMFGAMKVKNLHITPALDIGGFGLMLLEQTIGLEKFQSLESNTLAEIHEMVSKRVFSESGNLFIILHNKFKFYFLR
jgi:hypothetical protein